MGIISALTGNAGEITIEAAGEHLGSIPVAGEIIHKAFQLGRDLIVFTDRRLILVDHQGVTGSKTEWRSIPYRSVTNFSVESSGPMDLDAEMKIYVTGNPLPIQREFNKKVNVYEVQQLLANMVLAR